MLSLVRSDLFRITRPRGLRGSLWQYLVAIAGVYAAVFGLIALVESPLMDGLAEPHLREALLGFSSPAHYLANMLGGIVPLCVTFMTVEIALADFKAGFVKSILSSRQGRLSYAAEKIVFAGVVSAVVIAAASVMSLVPALAFGATFGAFDALELVGWLSALWLVCWALAVLSLVVVYATRVNAVSYIGAFCLCSGVVSSTIEGLAYSSGGILRFLQPIAPVLETAAAWMPSSALDHLGTGGFFNPMEAGMYMTALPISTGAQAVLTGIIWIVLGGLAVLAIVRKRDI